MKPHQPLGWLALITGGILISLSLMVVSRRFTRQRPVSPLSFPSEKACCQPEESQKIVFGFLPYWNLEHEPSIQYDKLTHLAFFGFNAAADGSIETKAPAGYPDPGRKVYQSSVMGAMVRKAHLARVKIILVLKAFDNRLIESILLSPGRRQKLIDETIGLAQSKNLDGINIDFEYAGDPPAKVKAEFTNFIQQFSAGCKAAIASCHFSVDAYADAAAGNRLWDLKALAPHIDNLIMMAYDFTRANSDYSGPVAPLNEIKLFTADYAKVFPLPKILLGVPYYGYEWPTLSKEPISKTVNPGYLATYRRISQMRNHPASVLGWDVNSFTPFLISTASGETTQIFYDDVRSLGLKYDFVNQADLAGIAIWALGYEGDRPELWRLLQNKFPSLSK